MSVSKTEPTRDLLLIFFYSVILTLLVLVLISFHFHVPKINKRKTIRKPSRQDPNFVASTMGSQQRGKIQLSREDAIQTSPADAAKPVRNVVVLTPSTVLSQIENGAKMRWVRVGSLISCNKNSCLFTLTHNLGISK